MSNIIFNKLVLASISTGKGTACIPDQHKINTIIKISYATIHLGGYLYMI